MLSNRILGGKGRSAQRSGARRASGKMRVPVSGGAVESGVRPEESNPWGRGSSGSYAARWGACAWPLRKEDPGSRSEEAVCVWGGAPCADEREILLLPVDPNGKRRRIQSTGEHPRARESAGVAAVKRGASVAHVVYGGFAQDAAAASATSDPPGAEGEPLGDAFLIDGNMRWRALVPFGGVAPPPRGGHALVPIASNKAFVFGGRGSDGAHLGDAWILELHSTASVAAGWSGKNVDARWEQSPVRDRDAPAPQPREAAGAAYVAPSKSAGENARWTSIGNMVRQLDPKSRTPGGTPSAPPSAPHGPPARVRQLQLARRRGEELPGEVGRHLRGDDAADDESAGEREDVRAAGWGVRRGGADPWCRRGAHGCRSNRGVHRDDP